MSPSGCLRQGWVSLALWISFGLLVEGLIGFRIPALLDDPVRREMFRLAHAHGTLLNLVLVAAAICARLELAAFTPSSALALRFAVVLMPAGFLLGGAWHFKDDPGFGILLVPAGAVLLLFAAVMLAFSVRSKHDSAA
jgi:hypothetical protein